MQKVTEGEEVSPLGCVDSGNKLQRQKEGPWSLGGRRAEKMHLPGRAERGWACSRVCAPGEKGGGGPRPRKSAPLLLNRVPFALSETPEKSLSFGNRDWK